MSMIPARALTSEICGAHLLGWGAVFVLLRLGGNQPLLLHRDGRPASIILSDLRGAQCGYLLKKDAAIVAPELDAGVLWCAKTLCRPFIGTCFSCGRRHVLVAPVLVWVEGNFIELKDAPHVEMVSQESSRGK
jgi:hypothetical protein